MSEGVRGPDAILTADDLALHGLGLPRGRVRLCASDPRWAEISSRLADSLRAALGTMAVSVEHVGSTAVPGLSAKPILDIAVAFTPDAVTEDVIGVLESSGFLFRGDKGADGGLLFVLEDRPEHRVAHAHVVRDGDAQWNCWLSFRDLLRADADARADYDRLKRELATEHPDDRRAYTRDKTSFIATRMTSARHPD